MDRQAADGLTVPQKGGAAPAPRPSPQPRYESKPPPPVPRDDYRRPDPRDDRRPSPNANFGATSPPPTGGPRPTAMHNRPPPSSRPPPSPAPETMADGADPTLLPLFRAVDKDGRWCRECLESAASDRRQAPANFPSASLAQPSSTVTGQPSTPRRCA